MKPLADCRLYTFVDTAYLHGRTPQALAQQLCDGGADFVQLRAKGASVDEVRRLAEVILPITRQAGVGLVINDHLSVACEVGAEFCHLGQGDFFGAGHTHVNEIRNPKSEIRIGLSTHSPDQAQGAVAAGADYVAVGPVFATRTKPGVKPVTLDFVRWAAAPQNGVTVPWFAIGGITLQNLDGVLAAGARRICVVSAILDAEDVTAACAEFKQRLIASRKAPPPGSA